APQEDRSRARKTVDAPVPEEMQEKYGLGKTIRVFKSTCPHCSDTGKATFYYDHKDRWRVWTFTEWVPLPWSMKTRLTASTAICDCEVGQSHKMRGQRTTIWWRGVERTTTLFPLLERIKQTSRQRRRKELARVG
ncbi:hypothetical protein LCGC14_2353080, partial [marine sediment metagenome]